MIREVKHLSNLSHENSILESKLEKAQSFQDIIVDRKDEFNKLEEIYSQFQKNFDITREQVEEEAIECRDDLIDLYYIIEEKYRKKHYVSKRGRPRKI